MKPKHAFATMGSRIVWLVPLLAMLGGAGYVRADELRIGYTGDPHAAIIVSFFDRQVASDRIVGTLQIENNTGAWVYIEADPKSTAILPSTVYLLGPWATKTILSFTFPQGTWFSLTATTQRGLNYTGNTPQAIALMGAQVTDYFTRMTLTTELPADLFDEGLLDPQFADFLSAIGAQLSPSGELADALRSGDYQTIVAIVGTTLSKDKDLEAAMTKLLRKKATADQVHNMFSVAAEDFEILSTELDLVQKALLVNELLDATWTAPPVSTAGLRVITLSVPSSITSVTPGTLTTAPLCQIQTLTIHGTGLTSESRLNFQHGGVTYGSIPSRLSCPAPDTLLYDIAVGSAAGSWTVALAEGDGTLGFQVVVDPATLYPVTPVSGAHGTIAPAAVVMKSAGESQTFVAAGQDNSYVVDSWSVDGVVVPHTGNTFTLPNIQGAHVVSVSFRPAVITPVASGTTVQGLISSPGDVDWFALNVTAPGVLSLSLSVPADTDYDLQLLDANGTLLDGSYRGPGLAESITFPGALPGNYAVRVYGYRSAAGGSYNTTASYSLTATLTPTSSVSNADSRIDGAGALLAGQDVSYSVTQVQPDGSRRAQTVARWDTSNPGIAAIDSAGRMKVSPNLTQATVVSVFAWLSGDAGGLPLEKTVSLQPGPGFKMQVVSSGHVGVSLTPEPFNVDGELRYAPGTVVEALATTDSGYTLMDWGSSNLSSNPLRIVMDADQSLYPNVIPSASLVGPKVFTINKPSGLGRITIAAPRFTHVMEKADDNFSTSEVDTGESVFVRLETDPTEEFVGWIGINAGQEFKLTVVDHFSLVARIRSKLPPPATDPSRHAAMALNSGMLSDGYLSSTPTFGTYIIDNGTELRARYDAPPRPGLSGSYEDAYLKIEQYQLDRFPKSVAGAQLQLKSLSWSDGVVQLLRSSTGIAIGNDASTIWSALPSGSDYGSGQVSVNGSQNIGLSITDPLNHWLAKDWTDDGLILRAQSYSAGFSSANATDPSLRPVLVMDWNEDAVSSTAPIVVGHSALNASLAVGHSTQLTVSAVGSGTLTYEWQKDHQVIPGATAPNLTVDNTSDSPGGVYEVTIANANGVAVLDYTVTTLLAQSIAFAGPGNQACSNAPVLLTASATSGLPVTFSVVSGPASVNGSTLTLTGMGTVIVRASQAGDANYAPAADVDQSFNVAAGFLSWQQSQFNATELADPSISGPNAVYGLDGLPNLVKYALGLDPHGNVVAGLPTVSTSGTDWVYTYSRPANIPDLVYEVEVSTDLTNWSTTGVTLNLQSSSGGVDTWAATYPLTSAANVFFRLKVTQQ